jgi:hypothetical protein
MNPGERAVAEEEDREKRGPHVAVEMSFNNIARKFTHTNYFPRHRILQNGFFFLQFVHLCRGTRESL